MSFTIKTLVVGQLQTNCYIVYETKTRAAYIIDPGDDAEYINNTLVTLALQPQGIFLTHGHFDHCLAAFEVQSAFHIPCFLHAEDYFLINRLEETYQHFTGLHLPVLKPILTKYDCNYSHIDQLELLELPGHTPGSVGLMLRDTHFVFSGDLVFSDGHIGRTDRSYASRDVAFDSLKKLYQLDKNTILFPGHGDSFVLSSIDFSQIK